MVGAGLILLLCLLLVGVDGTGLEQIAINHKLMNSAQIHYLDCERNFNCIIPSKYFDRGDEKSLLITRNEQKIAFRDGIEIHVINSTTWLLTLMANNSDVEVKFTFGNDTMLVCNKDTVADKIIFETPESTVRTIRDASQTYLDEIGEEVPGMVCKYKLERRDNITDRTMAVLFGTLVEVKKDEKMCFKVSGAVDEEYCNYIADLKPQMRLTFNPLNCSGCTILPGVCMDETECMLDPEPRNRSPLQRAEGTGCEYFINEKQLLVNNLMYTIPGTAISCIQGKWELHRFNPVPSLDTPRSIVYLNNISSVVFNPKGEQVFNCSFASPLKSVCRMGNECRKIVEWIPPIACEDPEELVYYGAVNNRKLTKVTCNEKKGIWLGHDEQENVTYTLRAGESLVCYNPEMNTFSLDSLDDFNFNFDNYTKEDEKKWAELRNDDEMDFTDAIIWCTVAGVAMLIVLLCACAFLASCTGSIRGRRVGLQSTEQSQRPVAAAGEEEMSSSQRLSLVFT